MAGAFGYHAEHYPVSMKMAEAGLLPAVRAADEATVVVADGTSCRHQIQDGAARASVHAAEVLHAAVESGARLRVPEAAQAAVAPRNSASTTSRR